MKFAFILPFLLASLNSSAETLVTSIHSSHEADGFVRLTNGRVAFLKRPQDFSKLRRGLKVRLDLDDKGNLHDFAVVGLPDDKDASLNLMEVERPPYTPTVLPDLGSASAMFDKWDTGFKRVSECSDRAHVWAYDEFKASGLQSQKVFAFFTASYINRNKFKWWFHVAPLVQVNEGGNVDSWVMDVRYTDRPHRIKDWTDKLVFSKRPCKMTTKFSEYDVNPQTEDCYMIIESMYYRLPGDISLQETANQYRSQFSDSEVSFSRRAGFESRTNGGN